MNYSIFIQNLINDFIKQNKSIESYVFIVPSNLFIIYFKNYIHLYYKNNSFWMPSMYTIDNFIEKISNIEISSKIDLYVVMYNFCIYKNYNIFSSFNNFMMVVDYIIQLFNFIDLNMIPSATFFSYLSCDNYLYKIFHSFASQKEVYKFVINLYYDIQLEFLNKGIAYKGFVFKKCIDALSAYTNDTVFILSRYLHKVELHLLRNLLLKKRLKVYCDINNMFYDAKLNQELYKYFKYLKINKKNIVNNNIKNNIFNNNVCIVSSSGFTNQINYINNILSKIKNIDNYQIGIFITDNNLIQPLIHNLCTKFIDKSDFYIKFSLSKSYVHETLVRFFSLYINRVKISDNQSFYFKDFSVFITDFFIKNIFKDCNMLFRDKKYLNIISYNIIRENINDKYFVLLFSNHSNNVLVFIHFMQDIIRKIRYYFSHSKCLTLNYKVYYNDIMFSLYTLDIVNVWIYNILSLFNKGYEVVKSIKDLFFLYKNYIEVKYYNFIFYNKINNIIITNNISNSSLLNFDISFVLSMNEGAYPVGKDNNFISKNLQKKFFLNINHQNDLKYSFILYNIIKNSKNTYLIYDHNIEHYTYGEQSRYIKYIQVLKKNVFINLSQDYPYYNIDCLDNILSNRRNNLLIYKNKNSINQLFDIISKDGISPYLLNLYLNNELEFYLKIVLNLHDDNNDIYLSKFLDNKLMGHIIHMTLFELYRDYQGIYLNRNIINILYMKYIIIIKKCCVTMNMDIHRGKDLIMFHIIKMYVHYVIKWDENNIINNKSILIKYIEFKISNFLFNYYNNKFHIKGIIDRIDIFDNKLRIIDYKLNFTEKVSIFNLNSNSNSLFDNKLIIQLLVYALLCFKRFPYIEHCIPGIFNYKLIKNNFLLSISIDNKEGVTKEFINYIFNSQLINIIKHIVDKYSPLNIKI